MSAAGSLEALATGADTMLNELIEQYAERLDAGETLDLEQCVHEHPEYAEQLRKLLPTMQVLAELGHSSDSKGASRISAAADGDAATGILGDFHILREIGRGGMGVVYEAEQISLGRRVALKVLPFAATMDKRQLQRFVNEARAAASLEHPHIVPVYGVGCERGVHYYAMRFIEGHSLDTLLQCLRDPAGPGSAQQETARGKGSTLKSSKRGKEDFRRIAALALQAAEALEHAHQSGVVHRDVKPANLLLDEDGNLWITDFGLAHIQSDTRLTMTGDLVGTLRYMSPEQALAKRVIVDQRTDVYSLGATFYEVLTLKPVFTGNDRQELLRQIAFEEPVAPRRINKSIPVEFETVILKALEKNPDERYGTAREMADDVRRFLNHEPTLARRPTVWQRGRKWTARHQAIVIATAVSLFIGAVGCAWQAVRAFQAEAAAEADRDQAFEAKKDTQAALAEAQAAKTAIGDALKSTEAAQRKAEAISKFLVEALRAADPEKDGRDVKVADVLDRAAAEVDVKFANDPAVKMELLDALGETYQGLGHYSKAVELHEKARAIRLELQGKDHLDTLKNGNRLAVAYLMSGRRSDALNISKETLERAKAKLGPDHDTTLGAMNNLGAVYHAVRQWTDAFACLEYVLNRLEAKLGKGHIDSLVTVDNLACAYADAGRFEEAITLHEAALKGRKAKLGEDHFFTLHSMNNLAHAYSSAKRREEAIPLYQQTLKLMQARFGLDHPLRLKCLAGLALVYRDNNRLADAVSLFEEALKGQLVKPGPGHPDTLVTMSLLGAAYRELGQTSKGIELLEKTLQRGKAELGADHDVTLAAMELLAQSYQQANQLPKSVALYEEINKLMAVKFGADHKDTLIAMNDLAVAYDDAGEESKALLLLEETLDKMKAKLPAGDKNTLTAMNNLGFRLWRKKDLARSVPLFEEAVKVAKAHFSSDDEIALLSVHNLAVNYLHAGRDAEAVPLFEQALELRNKVNGPNHASTRSCQDGLAAAYSGVGQFAKAALLLEKIVEDSKVQLGPGHASTLDAMNRLGVAYWKLKDLDKSVPLFEEAKNSAIAHLPADDPLVLVILRNLVVNYRDASRHVDTIAVLKEIVKRRKAKEPLHPQTLASIRELADAYLHAGKFEDAAPLLEESLKQSKAKFNLDHSETLQAMHSLGNALLQAGRLTEAISLLEETLKIRKAKLVPDHSDILNSMNTLGMAFRLTGRLADAQPLFEQNLAIQKAKRGAGDPSTFQSMRYLALILMMKGEHASAEPIMRECLEQSKKPWADTWPVFHNSFMLGTSLLGQKKFAEAEPLLVEGYEGIKKQEIKIAAFNKALIIEGLEWIVDLYETAGMPEVAAKWRTELEGAKARAKGPKV